MINKRFISFQKDNRVPISHQGKALLAFGLYKIIISYGGRFFFFVLFFLWQLEKNWWPEHVLINILCKPTKWIRKTDHSNIPAVPEDCPQTMLKMPVISATKCLTQCSEQRTIEINAWIVVSEQVKGFELSIEAFHSRYPI